jgi:hypothetical protein
VLKLNNHNDGKYLREKEVIKEALQLGIFGTDGTDKLGIDFTDPFHIIQYSKGLMPNGEPISKTAQLNKMAFLEATILLSPSVSKAMAMMSWEGQQKAVHEGIKPVVQRLLDRLEQRLAARTGAGGAVKKECELLAVSMVHASTREGHASYHVHVFIADKCIVKETQQIRTLDARPAFHNIKADNRITQIDLCGSLEKATGFAMDFDDKSEQAIAKGITNKFNRTARKEKAIEYIKEQEVKKGRKLPKKGKTLAYALKNTRPKKQKNLDIREESKKWAKVFANDGHQKLEQPRGFWQSIYQDLIKEPFVRAVKAWAIVKAQGQEKVRVRNLDQFVEDVSKPTSMTGHRAAITAIRRTKCDSLDHALAIGKKAFKLARVPKLTLPKGTKVIIRGKAIKTEEQEDQLRMLARKHGWSVKVIGPKLWEKQEQKRGQSL